MKKYYSRIGLGLAIMIFMMGLFCIKKTFDMSRQTMIEEHDAHLFDLAYSVDRNLKSGLSRIEENFMQLGKESEVINIVHKYVEEGDATDLKKMLSQIMEDKHYGLSDVLLVKGGEVVFSTKYKNGGIYSFLSEEENHGLCLNTNTMSHYFYLKIPSLINDLSFYVLIDLEYFYETVVAEPIKNDNWICLFDMGHGLLLQNHKNQPVYLVLTEEEIEDRKDGFTIMKTYDNRDELGKESYQYANPDGTMGNQRIVVVPRSKAENRIFGVAVAMDSGHIYGQLAKYQRNLILAFLLMIIAIIVVLIHIYSVYIRREHDQKEQEIKEKENEWRQMLIQSRIDSSISQMQPHFLYNALSSIREIVLEDPEYASDLIYDFTTHLRACIRSMSSGNSLVPFSQELENIEAYVNIEKMRFGNWLQVTYEIEEDDFDIVPLTIQPLVENAIRHGFAKRHKNGIVSISSVNADDSYVITVKDNGSGFDFEAIKKEVETGQRDSTGLLNLIFRLEHILKAKVDVQSVIGEGTTIRVIIPDIKKEQ